MPFALIAVATSRMSLSLTLQPNLFQLFHPMGGVRARPLSSARSAWRAEMETTTMAHTAPIVNVRRRLEGMGRPSVHETEAVPVRGGGAAARNVAGVHARGQKIRPLALRIR